MRKYLLVMLLLLNGGCGWTQEPAAAPPRVSSATAPAAETDADRLPPIHARSGRSRPLAVVVGHNYYTELTDYVVPYGILAASGAMDVMALAMESGPIRMFPAPMNVEPQATVAAFDARHPEGADIVVVPAVHRDEDPALLAWVAAQAAKGALVVGVCDGVQVLAHAGLLDGRKAVAHWYSFDDLRKQYPRTDWLRNRRYVVDGRIVTTTGVTASIPVSLALVEAVAGRDAAQRLAVTLGGEGAAWSSRHPSERFQLDMRHRLTVAGNLAAFWSRRSLGIAIEDGVDEIALALQAEVWSATYKSTAYTVAARDGVVRSKRGLSIVPDRTRPDGLQMLPPPVTERPLGALDLALKALSAELGERTAAFVALQMEYPGF